MNVVSDRPVARPPCILNPYLDGVGQVRRPNLYGSKVRKLPLAGDLRASGPERRPRRQNSSLVWVIPSRQIKSKCMMVLRAHMRPVKFYKVHEGDHSKDCAEEQPSPMVIAHALQRPFDLQFDLHLEFDSGRVVNRAVQRFMDVYAGRAPSTTVRRQRPRS